MIKIKRLFCEYQDRPFGIEKKHPLFSWSYEPGISSESNLEGFHLLVASSQTNLEQDVGDMWDFTVSSSKQNHIRYQGTNLEGGKTYWWKIRLIDDMGKQSAWKTASFDTALSKRQWNAKWISPKRTEPNNLPDSPDPAPLLRKSFTVSQPVSRARLHICGLGYYRAYINGEIIGDYALAPEVAQYDKTTYYDSYDVKDLIKTEKNVLAVELGNGWYNCFTKDAWQFQNAPWRHFPKLLAQLELTYRDGTNHSFCSDISWKWMEGPILFDGLRNGEHHDGRLEIHGWNTVSFDDDSWNPVMVTRPPGGILKASQMPQIRVKESIVPIYCKNIDDIAIFDMGKCISGYAELHLFDTKPGQTLRIHYGEKLSESGRVDTSDIEYLIQSGEFQTDRYITTGNKEETWSPKFTYHGFRYIEVTGYGKEMDTNNIRGISIHTDLQKRGDLSTDNSIINAIHAMCVQSVLVNYHSIPTDCPHREKNGWTGDAHLSSDQLLQNLCGVTAYRKFLHDIIDCQRVDGALPGIVPTPNWGYNWGSGPAWDSALIIMAWNLYLYDGDTETLAVTYDSICRYLKFMEQMEIKPGIIDFGLGDWCAPDRDFNGPKCPSVITDTGYYFHDFRLATQIAKVLGKRKDASRFAKKAEQIQQMFVAKFIDGQTGKMLSDSQTAYACAIHQHLVEGMLAEKVGEQLVKQVRKTDYHLDTGILGTKYLFSALSSIGRDDIAYRIVTNPTYPGWAYELTQGATTIWEHWDGQKSQMHHMFSDIDSWFYQFLAGMSPDPNEPGYRHTIFRPALTCGLGLVQCYHESPYGTVAITWKVQADKFSLELTIPPTCQGSLFLPETAHLSIPLELPAVFKAGTHRVEGTIQSYTRSNL